MGEDPIGDIAGRAFAPVFGVPSNATLTCLATVGVATIAGVGAALALDRLTSFRPAATARQC